MKERTSVLIFCLSPSFTTNSLLDTPEGGKRSSEIVFQLFLNTNTGNRFTFDNLRLTFLVPMQCTCNFGLLLCFHTTYCETYSFMTDGYGIFEMRTHFFVRAVHMKGGGGHVCIIVESEG